MPSRHPQVLNRDTTLLVVIDLQTTFLNEIHEKERVLRTCSLLARASAVLRVPVITTVQYVSRMGGLDPTISEQLNAGEPIDKLSFSCAASTEFADRLRASGRTQILLCGIETHICVAQTALDLNEHGFQVHIAADAVSSRTLERHKLGMEKMRDCGVTPCSAEQAVYELMKEAGTSEFKQILKFVKDAG